MISDGTTPVIFPIMCKFYNSVKKRNYLDHFIPKLVNLVDLVQTAIEPLISFYGWILVEICSFIFHMTQIQCPGDHKRIGLKIQKKKT